MNPIRALSCLVPLVLLSSACNGGPTGATSGAASPPNVTAGTSATPEAHERRGEHGADPTNALLDATKGVQLTDAQKTKLHSLEEQLEANERDTGEAFRAQRTALAAQVRAGAIDLTKVQADESAAGTALQAHITKEADTLNGLHAVLDPSQRKAVVAAVRGRRGERAEGRSGAEHTAPSADTIAKKRLDHMTRALGLDAAQQKQVASLLASEPAAQEPKGEDRGRRMDALLTAFEADSFDAKTAVPGPSVSPSDMIRARTDREVAFLSKLLPVLRPDQREKLAAEMEGGGKHDHDDDD